MSSRLRDDPDTLAVLVQQAADAVDVRPSFLEKDFWAIEMLRTAQPTRSITLHGGDSADVSFLFKGGTSLSRAFGIVERFSEDIDLLAVFPDDTSNSARDRVLKQVHADVGAHLGLAPIPAGSTTGIKRFATYQYPASYPDADLTAGVLLELGSRGGAHPSTEVSIRSMLAEVSTQQLGVADDDWEEFAPFTAHVLAPERTLLEKLSALHTAAVTDSGRLSGTGRHLYDIHQLLGDRLVLDALHALGTDGVAELAADVDAHSRAAGFAATPRPAEGFASSPAFQPGHLGIAGAYAGVGVLVYGSVPSLDAILARIQEQAGLL